MREINTLYISHKAGELYHNAVQKNAGAEIAGAFALERWDSGSTAKVIDFHEYTNAKKNSDSVSFTSHDMDEADHTFSDRGYRHAWITHSHVQRLWHAHDRSDQDKKMISQHEDDERTDFHILGYRKEWETVLKAVNRYGKEISLVLDDGQRGNEVSLWHAA